jgi:hypothetical protein
MNDIEKLIKAAAPADAQLPEGHLERFEAKLAGIDAADKYAAAAKSRIRRFATGICAAAAVIAAVIFIARPATHQPTDWFAGIADDPVEICRTYSEKSAVLCSDILRKDLDGSLSATVRSLTDSAVPMIDQLPEDLGASVQSGILKNYYGKLLDGLDKINKNI